VKSFDKLLVFKRFSSFYNSNSSILPPNKFFVKYFLILYKVFPKMALGISGKKLFIGLYHFY